MVQQKLVSSEKTNEKEKICREELKPQLRFSEFTDNWKESNLGNLFNFSVAGDMDKELFSEIKDEEFKYPLYANALEKEGLLGYYKESKYIANSITITARGNIGHSIVRKSDFNAIGRLIILNSKKELNNDFFSEYINSNLKFYIESTGVPQLTAPSLKINKVKYPNLDEQNKISNFILAINKKIELLEKKLVLYQQLEKDIRKSIFNFNNEKVRFNKFLLGEIAEIKKGFTPSTQNEEFWDDGKYLWLSIADMNKKYLTETSKKITEKAIKNKEIVPKNTLVMSFKLTIGKLAILKEDMFTNEAIASFNWKNKKISTEYMYFYLKSINIKKYGSQAAKGITLNNETLNSIPVYLPDSNKQKEIVEILLSFNNKIDLVKTQLTALNRFKKGLLQKMFI